MAVLQIAKLGNPILRQVARRVTEKECRTAAFQRFLDDLVDTMRVKDGVGLAAPQVSQSVQAIVIESEESTRYRRAPRLPLLVMINPTITAYSEETVEGWEGCLSLDNLRGRVARSIRIHVDGFDRFMEPVSIDAERFLAVVFQHEVDHLNGKLFIDRMTDLTALTHLAEYDLYWGNSDAESNAPEDVATEIGSLKS
jgi:peptide deformylase